MEAWEKYEEKILNKLSKEFPDSELLKNQRIKGIYSKRSRQIDILINGELIGKKIIGVIDCKQFNKKIDVKTVESFIGVGANIGIMITNKGYSKSAKNRITNYPRNIHLDVIEFNRIEDYHFEWCEYCYNKEGFPRGEIIWDEPEALIKDGIITVIERGECPYCGESYIKCQGCGKIIHIDENIGGTECLCGNIFSVESEYIGDGMTESKVLVKSH
jgi:hypothetical protein